MFRGVFSRRTFTPEQTTQMDVIKAAYDATIRAPVDVKSNPTLLVSAASDSAARAGVASASASGVAVESTAPPRGGGAAGGLAAGTGAMTTHPTLAAVVATDPASSIPVETKPTSASAGVREAIDRPTTKNKSGKYRLDKPIVSTSSYSTAVWLPKIREGNLKIYIEEMLRQICLYQSQRITRHWWNSGYPDEPIQLACEEMKTFLVQLSSPGKKSEILLQMINARIEYLDCLLRTEVFLPSYAACREGPGTFGLAKESVTFYTLLLELRNTLANSIKPRVETVIGNASARTDLRNLTIFFRQMVQHSIGYLFFILNPMEIPDGFTLDEIRRGDAAPYEKFLKTIAGQCLKKLVTLLDTPEKSEPEANPFFPVDGSGLRYYTRHADTGHKLDVLPSFHALRPMPTGAIEADESIIYVERDSADVLKYKSTDSTKMLKEGTIVANDLPLLRGIDLSNVAALTPLLPNILRIISSNGNIASEEIKTGVHADFYTLNIMKTFVFLHALFAEIISVDATWKLAYRLAGEGGDILVYGFANLYINWLLGSTETLMNKLHSELLKLQGLAYDHFAELCRKNNLGDKDYKHWVNNFRRAQMYYAQLGDDLLGCRRIALMIRNRANSVTLSERLHQAKGQLSELREGLKRFSCLTEFRSPDRGELTLMSTSVRVVAAAAIASPAAGIAAVSAAALPRAGLLPVPSEPSVRVVPEFDGSAVRAAAALYL